MAEYWTKTSRNRQDPQSCIQPTAGRPYLNAAVSNAVGPRMVRKVAWSITSHDQGWRSYRQFHGTYEGSWTWLEAEVHLTAEEETSNCIRRDLCRNVHAERSDKIHVVTWRYDADDEEERILVRSLGSEGTISVVPWARFPGWENHVSYANVEIYAAAVMKIMRRLGKQYKSRSGERINCIRPDRILNMSTELPVGTHHTSLNY